MYRLAEHTRTLAKPDHIHSDTSALALLIDEREEILENLEIAEAKYIDSFKLTTPDPSVVDLPVAAVSDVPPPVPPKPEISRPRPLAVGSLVVVPLVCLNIHVFSES